MLKYNLLVVYQKFKKVVGVSLSANKTLDRKDKQSPLREYRYPAPHLF